MAFHWDDYLSVAQVIASDVHPKNSLPVCKPLQTENAEARYRVAVSRAYYAALGVCRKYIVKSAPLYPITNTSADHALVRNYFIKSNHSDKDVKGVHNKMGQALGRLSDARNLADYDLSPLDWAKTASDALEDAEFVCQALMALEDSGD